MAKMQNVDATFDEFKAIATKEYKEKKEKAMMESISEDDVRATALVSMTKSSKERLTTIAKIHGLSLSAFFRLAADEYISNHAW